MRINAETETGKRNGALYVIVTILLILGTTAGSIYLMKHSENMGEGIQGYISGLFASMKDNADSMTVFKNSLVSNLVCTGIIFVMGFFRIGCIPTGAILVRKGFVMGFTAASFFKFYGAKGMLIMLSTMPAELIAVPALLIFSAVSVNFSLNRDKRQKKLIISYIFFLVLIISIFCVAALAEGFLTTTFMKLLSPKIN